MNAGQVISGAGHIGLIGWLLFSGLFQSTPPEVEVTPVSIVTAEEFAALQNPQQPPPAPEPQMPRQETLQEAEPEPLPPEALTETTQPDMPAPEPEPTVTPPQTPPEPRPPQARPEPLVPVQPDTPTPRT
ncbi:hypothetical protein [Pseudooceanicola algae]|uniref:Cell envelope biogenesis protein TolA n=1 Tax=Pseudooceanicola algae TaxID=1537215 RepID=A0A7T1BR75_9RHOB|nr:hypothetical protein [Pseudooceanicola algae]QPM88930.1 hypothetical protein PSAL_001330 [Pseudooceanicola algae]